MSIPVSDRADIAGTSDTPNAIVDRVVSILSAFPGAASLTSAQISLRSQLPRSSVHRLLQRLVALGLVERDGYQYRIGLRLFELGSAALDNHGVQTVALPFLNQVNRVTGFGTYLAMLSGPDIVFTEGVWSDWRGPRRLGTPHPAHLTAAGKMLLACLEPRMRPQVDLGATAMTTDFRVTSRTALDQELLQVRKVGYAEDRGRYVAGSGSVAVPVGPPREATTALAVWGPVGSVDPARVVNLLRQTARTIWDASLEGRAKAEDRTLSRRVASVNA